jgi:acetyl-CoA carboxylase alpha subunit
MEMSRLPTPMMAAVIGEGGSGGALGIAVADRVAVMEHAYYSVISPEGCARDPLEDGRAGGPAAEALRLTGNDLRKLNLIDDIIAEPLGGAHRAPEVAAANLETWIAKSIRDLTAAVRARVPNDAGHPLFGFRRQWDRRLVVSTFCRDEHRAVLYVLMDVDRISLGLLHEVAILRI